MREQPRSEGRGRFKEGTYGDFKSKNVGELGFDIQMAITRSLEDGKMIDSSAMIEYEIIVNDAGLIERKSVRVIQTGPQGFNVNIRPSDELCRLLIERES